MDGWIDRVFKGIFPPPVNFHKAIRHSPKFILREEFEGVEDRPRLRGRNSQLKMGVKATVFWQAMTVVGAKNGMH